MKLTDPYRVLGEVDLGIVDRLMPRKLNPAWHHPDDDWRSKSHTHHKDTISLVFRWVWYKGGDIHEEFVVPDWNDKMHAFESMVGMLVGTMDSPIRTLVACLRPGGHIESHQDNVQWFSNVRRIHIPLYVPDGCHFIVRGVEVPMRRGRVIEISNLDFHEVHNDSAEERYHIIMDFVDAGVDVSGGAG